MRARLLAVRRSRSVEEALRRSSQIQARLLETSVFEQAGTVALYAALPGEVATEELFRRALAAGKRVCFPRCSRPGLRLEFHRVDALEQLTPRTLGIREPDASRPVIAVEAIDLFVVPGVGFSPGGARLGHGKGYYDATLGGARADARKVGLAFADQLVDAAILDAPIPGSIPIDAWDVPMDFVITEAQLFDCAKGRGARGEA